MKAFVLRAFCAVVLLFALYSLALGAFDEGPAFQRAFSYGYLVAVPFTLQPMIVILAGAMLGSRLGAASMMGYLALGVIGLPVFAASPLLPQGAARLLGPTGGYLMAYPIAAFVTGVLVERGFSRRFMTALVAMLAGVGVIYAGGLTWLAGAHVTSFSLAVAAGAAPFLIADLCKAVLAAAIVAKLPYRM